MVPAVNSDEGHRWPVGGGQWVVAGSEKREVGFQANRGLADWGPLLENANIGGDFNRGGWGFSGGLAMVVVTDEGRGEDGFFNGSRLGSDFL